jgi:polysaccharide export outer membrane protein
MRGSRFLGLAAAAVLLAGCAIAPKSGPTSGAVLEAAEDPDATALPFAFARLTPETVETLESRGAVEGEDISGAAGRQGHELRVGDVVSVTIWEAVDGGLFSGAGGGARATTLPPQRIGPSGRISAPYAGPVRAAGRNPDAVAESIAAALEGKAIEPQVLVTVAESPVSSVTVVGDAAARSARVPLAGVGERVLDVIASAGGSSAPAHRTLVRLTRGEITAETHLARILREPAQNVTVRAGDVVSLMDIGQSFTVLGAANQPRRIPFQSESVTLDEALGEAGGLADFAADPEAVYVFRYEDAEIAEALTGEAAQGPVAPVVYNLDLRDPGAFFLARRFEMLDGDIIYAANAPLANARKVLNAIAQVLTPATSSLRLANALDD